MPEYKIFSNAFRQVVQWFIKSGCNGFQTRWRSNRGILLLQSLLLSPWTTMLMRKFIFCMQASFSIL